MKWANRDINVVEWANIPKFSTLDDIVTPLGLLELFFDDVLVDMIFGYTKLYSHREKAEISFEFNNERKVSAGKLVPYYHFLPNRMVLVRR